jgi:hypothetical protein
MSSAPRGRGSDGSRSRAFPVRCVHLSLTWARADHKQVGRPLAAAQGQIKYCLQKRKSKCDKEEPCSSCISAHGRAHLRAYTKAVSERNSVDDCST